MLMAPTAPLGTLLLWAALIAVGNAQSLSELVGLGEFTEAQRKYCQFAPGESPTCENCVAKGTQQELKRAEMQNRHSLRTKQREQELESYRIKYGLPTRMSPDGNPI
ncbi:hypothetical protein Aduo_010106 [Ancylostoma duodenale]